MTAIVVLTGSRDLTWELGAHAIRFQLARMPAGTLVFHGACPCRICWRCPCVGTKRQQHLPISADTIADHVARDLGLAVERRPADWTELGRSAGRVRNCSMVNEAWKLARRLHVPCYCVGWPQPGGSGTQHCLGYARRKGLLMVNGWDLETPLPEWRP